jgi:hypothetical protein
MLAKYSLRFNNNRRLKIKFQQQTDDVALALRCSVATATASVKLENDMVPAISSSRVANITHFKNRHDRYLQIVSIIDHVCLFPNQTKRKSRYIFKAIIAKRGRKRYCSAL